MCTYNEPILHDNVGLQWEICFELYSSIEKRMTSYSLVKFILDVSVHFENDHLKCNID